MAGIGWSWVGMAVSGAVAAALWGSSEGQYRAESVAVGVLAGVCLFWSLRLPLEAARWFEKVTSLRVERVRPVRKRRAKDQGKLHARDATEKTDKEQQQRDHADLVAALEEDRKVARVFPRRKHGEKQRCSEEALSFTFESLQPFFHLPIKQAASRLKICATSLKAVCRKLGIARWPMKESRARLASSSASAKPESKEENSEGEDTAALDPKHPTTPAANTNSG
ncbi:RWP-RK domain-containing protein [Baffinella frigidus]|nr:RWP-RK domain-containing protein [Cryptophyta sp. CCMP2293]